MVAPLERKSGSNQQLVGTFHRNDLFLETCIGFYEWLRITHRQGKLENWQKRRKTSGVGAWQGGKGKTGNKKRSSEGDHLLCYAAFGKYNQNVLSRLVMAGARTMDWIIEHLIILKELQQEA